MPSGARIPSVAGRFRYREVMRESWFDGAHRWGVVLASGLLTLTGCGIASPADSAAPAAPPQPPPQPPPPGRPFELPLQTASSCEVLSRAQQARLGFDEDPLPASSGVTGTEHSCAFRDDDSAQSARIGLVTSRGPLPAGSVPNLRATPVGVAGFPAVVVRRPGLDRACDVQVDVAGGQHLDVLYTQYGRGDPPPPDQLCQRGQQVAGNAVSTLAHPGSAADRIDDADSGASEAEQLRYEAVSPRLPSRGGR